MPTDQSKKSPNAKKRVLSELLEFAQFGLGCLSVVSFIVIGLLAHYVFDKSWIASFWIALAVALFFKIAQELLDRFNQTKRRRNS